MPLDRRQFLQYISLGCLASPLTLSGCTHRRFYNPDQDIILGGGRFKQNGELRQVLAVINLQQKETKLVDLDFLAHGISIDPKNKKRLFALEKNGTIAAEIDLNNHQQTKTITSSSEKIFGGHGVFNKTGDTLFCNEIYQNDFRGVITLRDTENFKVFDEFPSYGSNPHDCLLIDDGATIVVTNAGSLNTEDEAASVAYIDIKSQSLIERVTLSSKLKTGHIGIAEGGSLVVSSAPAEISEKTPGETPEKKNTNGGISIRSGGQAILTMAEPEMVISRLTGEALSVAIDNKNRIAAITHPDSNMVTFWSIDKRELVKAMNVPQPRGVALSLDGKSFIVSYDINTSVVLVDTKELTASTDTIIQPTYITGDHITNWSKTLTEIMPANIY